MNQRARTTGLIVAFILAFAFPATAAPAPDAAQMRAKISAYVENALATQGGSRILFKVDSDALREAIVMDLREEVFQILHDGRIPFAGLALRDGGVEVRIANANDRQKVVSKLVPAMQAPPPTQAAPTVTDSGDGLIRFVPTDSRFERRLNELLQQSIQMIAQRLRDSGIRLADAQPDEPDRIRVLLPGIRDPERVAAIFSKRAHVAFRLADVSMTPAEALKKARRPQHPKSSTISRATSLIWS
jgi:preprotein translocase subunit SecD